MAKPYEVTSDEVDPEDVVAFASLLNQRRNAVKKLLQAHNYGPKDKLGIRKKEKTIATLQRQIAIMDKSVMLCMGKVNPLFNVKGKGGKDGKKEKTGKEETKADNH